MLADYWWTVGGLMVDCWQTVGKSANRLATVRQQAGISPPIVHQQSANRAAIPVIFGKGRNAKSFRVDIIIMSARYR